MFAMGSLLTEGEHLYLDRSADWRTALRLILDAAREEEDRTDAAAVVLRDLPDGDAELHDVLLGEGFARVPVFDTWTRPVDFATDEEFLAGLSKKARYHQRTHVLAWEDAYKIEVVTGDSEAARQLPADERDELKRTLLPLLGRSYRLEITTVLLWTRLAV
jgi:hypothetical protein